MDGGHGVMFTRTAELADKLVEANTTEVEHIVKVAGSKRRLMVCGRASRFVRVLVDPAWSPQRPRGGRELEAMVWGQPKS
jgi:hypothetical protein